MALRKLVGLTTQIFFLGTPIAATASCEAIQYTSKTRGKEVRLQAELCLPHGGKAPFRTIILQHSSGPDVKLSVINGRTDEAAKAVGDLALRRNFAVVYTDSFTPRNIGTSNKWGTDLIGSSEMAKDIVRLVGEIQKDDRIDQKKLFLYGQSQGGGVAIKASYLHQWERARFLRGRPTPFAAVFASAPGCHVQYDDVIGQPLKIMTGERDDWAPVTSCISLQESQKRRGITHVEIEIVPGAIHTWSTDGGQWNPDVKSYRDCQDKVVIVKSDGSMFRNERQIEKSQVKDCLSKGATSRGNRAKLPFVAEKVLAYFEQF
jgi:dienelactone hydrolase